MQQRQKWQIWVDTGGTFTDCIARDPEGKIWSTKVLSSAALRGRITGALGEKSYQMAINWEVEKAIFKGYELRLLGHADFRAQVVRLDPVEGQVTLDRSLPQGRWPLDFEISAGEEAPILAARIITQTPLASTLPPLDLRLGSTKGTNALLERKGAKIALLITKGFADLLAIGTQQRPHLFQLNIPDPELLYDLVIEVEERLDAKGQILQPLHDTAIEQTLAQLRSTDIEAVAIAFLHAYRNPAHEARMAAACQAAGFPYCSSSAALSPSIKLLPRAQTALVNAYLAPVIGHYLSGIHRSLGAAENSHFRMMTSAGGLIDARRFQPKDSLLSGPAGGVVGAARIAIQLGYPRVLTLDMGGTSTDTARFDQGFDYRYLSDVGGIELANPSMAIETVAAGGGSRCYFDGHQLRVGPESAGAWPGPACYGAGGPLTITDVNLLLGKMEPSRFGIPIDEGAAHRALLALQATINQQTATHYTALELLRGFEQIANEKMAEAIRRISIRKGFAPGDYALLVFGGAGGMHACGIAELLSIDRIVLPYQGGLLSAYGIGQAQIERFVQRQLLLDFEEGQAQLPAILRALSDEALEELRTEGLEAQELTIRQVLVYLRFKGQESSLEVAYEDPKQLRHDFEERYRQLFGHWPNGRKIELESIKVIAATLEQNITKEQEVPTTYQPTAFDYLSPRFEDIQIALYDWADLRGGAQIEGPALLLNKSSTALIEEGWRAEVKTDRNIILEQSNPSASTAPEMKTAIELELFTNRFKAIAEEMGAQLQRTAFSVNIKERLDFSCALLDQNARLLVNAPHIPVHLGSLGICARLVLAHSPLGPGDVIITNHPAYGGSHLPDVTLLSAVFTTDQTLIGYVINRAHHAEIGGSRPGSMPPDARSLAQEGVVISPTYLVRAGVVQWQIIRDLLEGAEYPTRSIAENLADINAALAALRSGSTALQKLVQQYGLGKVHRYMGLLQAHAATALAHALQAYGERTFSAEEALDDGHRICLEVQLSEQGIHFDFSGTSAVHPYNLNANQSIVHSALIYVLRLLCNQDIPLNEGLMQAVTLELPHSLLHPEFAADPRQCPAVVGGNTEVSQRLVDTLLKALGLAACSQGTMNNLLFGNDRFGYYETIGGGAGAGPDFAGRSAVHQHMTNTRITDPEDLEFRYPVRLWRFAIRRGSGGRGRCYGGDGILRELEFLERVALTVLTQHRRVAPYGMDGGQEGQRGEQYLIRKDGTKEPLEGADSRQMQPGDRLLMATPGGGGWGQETTKV